MYYLYCTKTFSKRIRSQSRKLSHEVFSFQDMARWLLDRNGAIDLRGTFKSRRVFPHEFVSCFYKTFDNIIVDVAVKTLLIYQKYERNDYNYYNYLSNTIINLAVY